MLKANRLLIITSLICVFSLVSCGGGDEESTALVANAGPDQNVATGSQVTLDGSGSSDADGDTLTYNWSFISKPAGSGAALSDSTVVNPTFTADVTGAYVVSLVVNDGTADSAADTVTITAASVINLPKTGQTVSYATGDDGELQRGVSWPSPRFTDNGDGTVTDNLTGLMWLKDGNCFGTKQWLDWSNNYPALETVADFNSNPGTYSCTDYTASYTDWRLPNRKELHSLTDFSQVNSPALPSGHPFNNVQSSNYWSSTTGAYDTGSAWFVYMYDGYVSRGNKIYNSYYVWPVRAATTQPAQLPQTGQTTSYAIGDDGDIEAGVSWPSPRFTDNGDGTVTDNLTGLMWLKDGNCFGTKQWFDGSNNYPALETVADFNSNPGTYSCTDYTASYTDWRLPNVNELESLINAEEVNIATWLDAQGFTNVVNDYWSSTTSAYDTDYAWGVYIMYYGNLYDGSKTYSSYVWPVRAGQ